MKKLFFTMIMAAVTLAANAIIGVYQTYDDFKNGNLITFDGGEYKTAGRFLEKTISGRVKGEQKTFFWKDIYGINLNGELYRIYNYGGAVVTAKLYTSADYQLYLHEYKFESMGGGQSSSTYIWYISKGLDGDLYRVNSKGEFEGVVNAHPEFKELQEQASKIKGQVITQISKVIYGSPNYKLGKDAVPPVK